MGDLTNLQIATMALTTLKVAFFAVVLLTPPAVACGWWLARYEFPGKTAVETLLLMPMIVPPVATGLFLLTVLSPHGSFGRVLSRAFGGSLLLTWQAAAIAAAVVAFPLFVRAAKMAFAAIPPNLERVARTLGKSAPQVFWRISLPLAAPGLVQGALLAFARATGEFGATSLVAGNIPGVTETLALGIYARIIANRDGQAWVLTAVAFALAYLAVFAGELWLRKHRPEVRYR